MEDLEVISIDDKEPPKKTVQIDYDVWKKIKLEALDSDRSIAEVVERLVEYYGL